MVDARVLADSSWPGLAQAEAKRKAVEAAMAMQ
jgi:hypothetical protein